MKILVVGNGGREHALVWKLVNDSRKPDIFCAPGNAGTACHGKIFLFRWIILMSYRCGV